MEDGLVYNFNMFLWNSKDKNKLPTKEDIEYITINFFEAAKTRGLAFNGSCEIIEVTWGENK